jgi:saccharopine dehydrogenase-like NADP-dependent oxidoreductase
MTKYELVMGTKDGISEGDAVCQVDGCSLSIKWHATEKTTNVPIVYAKSMALNIVKTD